MQELIEQVMQKVGLDQGKAEGAVDTVMRFLKARLPEPVGQQLDSLMNGQEQSSAPSLGALFGGRH